jgi:hypothetical protein
MAVTRSSKRARVIFCALILLLAMGTGRLAHAKGARSQDSAYVDALQGDWDMSGTFLGKPVKYHARGQRVLHGGFLRLHMTLTPRSKIPLCMTPMQILLPPTPWCTRRIKSPSEYFGGGFLDVLTK